MKSIREYIILIESADAPLISGITEGHNQFLVKELINDQQVIDYVRTTLIPEMRAYGVPITPHNHYSRLSSAIFESVSGVIDSGKKFLKTFEKLDQRRNMKITVGTMVSILNLRMSKISQNYLDLKLLKK